MKLLTQLPAWLRNKFFIAFAAFAVWMLFFDERDVFKTASFSRRVQSCFKAISIALVCSSEASLYKYNRRSSGVRFAICKC